MRKTQRFLSKFSQGFTLIEILVVIGIIAVLATVVLIAINPARQFKQARDSQRLANLNAILNSVGQNMVDNKGIFTCAAGVLPSSAIAMKDSGGYDIANCIVPTYISSLPYDPSSGAYTDSNNYDTGYTIVQAASASGGRITVSATGEITNPIAVTR